MIAHKKRFVCWWTAALVLLAASVPLWAQDPAPGVPNPEAPSVRVEFPNAPVSAILPYYEALTGKRIIQDANLTGANITVTSTQMLTRGQAISFIESVLLLNGYAFIPVDENTLKLVNYASGKSPRSQGLPVVASPNDLPDTDAVVNYVMELEHISPEEAVRTFSQVVSLNPYGAITPLSSASGVVITENTSVIRSLIDLKTHVDVPPAQVSNEFVKLQRADADKVAEIISSVYEAQTGIAPIVAASGSNPGAGGQSGPAANLSAAGTAAPGPKVLIIPYRRTNSVLVIARPVDITYIRGLVETLDQPSDGINFLKRKLRYVSVLDYLPVAYNALARDTDIESPDDLMEGAQPGGQPDFRQSGRASTGSTGYSGSSGSGGQITAPDRLSEPEEDGGPQSYVIGNTLLIADSRNNSLIASGSPEQLEIVEKLIDEIDIEPKQVYISTVIGQLTLGDDLEYGLNALQTLETFKFDDGNEILGAGSYSTGGPLTDVGGLDSFENFPLLRGLTLYGQFAYGDMGTLNSWVRLLARDSRFRILSRPSVYAQNNVKAVISSGQRIAVPISTLTTLDGSLSGEYPGSITSNIEYRDVVLKLEVVPLINSDDEVTLKIAQLNDNIVGSQNISGNEIPTISTQELLTTVTVKHGSTIVLGGLITEREEKTETGIPVVRKIPVLGKVLGGTEKSISKEELLIFIQPHIISGSRAPTSPNELEHGRSTILDDVLDFSEVDLSPQAEVRKKGMVGKHWRKEE